MSAAKSWHARHSETTGLRDDTWTRLSTFMALHLADAVGMRAATRSGAPAAPGVPEQCAEEMERERDWMEMLGAVSIHMVARHAHCHRRGTPPDVGEVSRRGLRRT
jgi:hypothetical protein